MNYLIYPLSILFTLTFAIYSKWQFSDDRGESQGKWHGWGMIMRILVPLMCVSCSLWPAKWQDILLALSINCFVWDIGINLIALHVRALYTGSTDKFDIKLSGKKWLLYLILLVGSLTIKIFI